MKTKTQIEQVALEGLTNRQKIQDLFKLTDLEYNQRLYNCGLEFLELLFPFGTSFESFNQFHATQKLYWSWFRVQYERSDAAFIRSMDLYPGNRCLEKYEYLVPLLLTTDPRFQNAFNNYLTALKRHEKTMLAG